MPGFGCRRSTVKLTLALASCISWCVPHCSSGLFAGLAPRYPLFQRVALMQLVRSLLGDPVLTYHLFASYDLAVDRKLDAVQV